LRLVLLALFAGLALAQLPAGVHADGKCLDPQPIGRCGAFDRENVVFCFVLVQGRMVSGTSTDAIALGGPKLVGSHDNSDGRVFVRLGPSVDLLKDPYNAPLPRGDAFQDSNGVPGLQTQPVTCASFVWYAECGTWMGPFDPIQHAADAVVA
jgi:hypothetical protein